MLLAKEKALTVVCVFCKASEGSRDTTFTAQGLTENGEYLFRVIAVNENGQSLPLEALNPIVAKLPFDPPDAPGTPVVTSIGGDFVSLTWEKPKSDGGSRITGYWIDKREKGTIAWQQVNSNLPCITTMMNVPNLVEDREYEFRVMAINEAGKSPPSQASKIVKVKDPEAAEPPEFVIPLKKIMAKQGNMATFTCTVSGVPKPKITWFKGAREILGGGRYSVIHDGNTYSLTISEVYGEDADEYTVRASNSAGLRTSRAQLLIKSPPKILVPSRFRDSAPGEKGQNVILKIPFTGFLKPKIRWTKDGVEMESGAHFDVDVKGRHD